MTIDRPTVLDRERDHDHGGDHGDGDGEVGPPPDDDGPDPEVCAPEPPPWWGRSGPLLVSGAFAVLLTALGLWSLLPVSPDETVQVPRTAAVVPLAGTAPGPGAPGAPPGTAVGPPTHRVDPAWVEMVAEATGIPPRAVLAYASAELTVAAEQPGCGLAWNTLAGIGAIESHHGTYGGATLRDDGRPDPPIRGIPLDGREGVAAIADSDGGAWDDDATWDRAVGPLQFIPTTWQRWGSDGDGDGTSDPDQIDDAALAAGRYLCASGPLTDVDGWRGAVLTYNRSTQYVDDVALTADRYAHDVQAAP